MLTLPLPVSISVRSSLSVQLENIVITIDNIISSTIFSKFHYMPSIIEIL